MQGINKIPISNLMIHTLLKRSGKQNRLTVSQTIIMYRLLITIVLVSSCTAQFFQAEDILEAEGKEPRFVRASGYGAAPPVGQGYVGSNPVSSGLGYVANPGHGGFANSGSYTGSHGSGSYNTGHLGSGTHTGNLGQGGLHGSQGSGSHTSHTGGSSSYHGQRPTHTSNGGYGQSSHDSTHYPGDGHNHGQSGSGHGQGYLSGSGIQFSGSQGQGSYGKPQVDSYSKPPSGGYQGVPIAPPPQQAPVGYGR